MRRRALPLLLVTEILVVAALVLAAWHLALSRVSPVRPASGQPPAAAPAASPPGLALPSPPAARPPASPAAPGLSTLPTFWQAHLTQVNRDESSLERLQWRMVRAVEAFARAYIENVVLPAVRAASDRGRP